MELPAVPLGLIAEFNLLQDTILTLNTYVPIIFVDHVRRARYKCLFLFEIHLQTVSESFGSEFSF